MRHFFAAYETDAGIKKDVNQDSLLLKLLKNETEEILLAVLCDGMGGMERGELASATVVQAFDQWFRDMFIRGNGLEKLENVQRQWQTLLEELNAQLLRYGKKQGIALGTTATAILLSSNGSYLIGHIGDTRIYRMKEKIIQITEDHSYAENVLLQCVGINRFLRPQFTYGFVQKGESILLCSDGFRHMITEQEIYENLYSRECADEQKMKRQLRKLIELNKKRRETDNISAILIKVT